MPTCPLCESTQAVGEVCDVCGRPFPAAEAVPPTTPRLPELEPTGHAGAGDDGPISRLADLEPTAEPDGGRALDPEPVEGFSPTAVDPVEVVVTPLEVERVGDDAVLDLPAEKAPASCRYCGTPASPGDRLCARCGMRLPLVRTSAPRQADAVAPCRDCGIPMTGAQCPACGARRGTVR